MKNIVLFFNELIVNKGIFILFYYVLVLGIVALVFKYTFKKLWDGFKIKYQAPINTYSKGKAVWSNKKDIFKDYVKVEYYEAYTSGIIVNRICEVYILNIKVKTILFYKMKENSKIDQLNEKLSKTSLTNNEIKNIMNKYQNKTFINRLRSLEKFKVIKLKDMVTWITVQLTN